MSDDERARALPRCTMPGCPVRYRGGGEDRPCSDHADTASVASFDTRKSVWGDVLGASTPRA